MNAPRHAHRSHGSGCTTWPAALRWLAFLLIAPLMTFGALDGAAFLADGSTPRHQTPYAALVVGGHAAPTRHAVRFDARKEPPRGARLDDDEDGEFEHEPAGTPISLPDYGHPAPRDSGCNKKLAAAISLALITFLPPPSPPAISACGALDLCELSARQRLVRTSQALLI